MKPFPLHATDFYKTGHIRQYPEGTQYVYSNFTCRDDRYASWLPAFERKTVFFGLQAVIQSILIDLWQTEFFDRPKAEVLRRYRHRMDQALGPGAVETTHIEALHELGYLPLRIKALPEGARVDIKVPLFTIINTDPRFYWLTNYVETQLSAELWKPITSATTAFEYRRYLHNAALETGADPDAVAFQGHDFSMRGMSGLEDAAKSGAAHLTSFMGTDTITAIDYLETYYQAEDIFIGGSVPATEHSVMCMGGQDGEIETFRRLITEIYPKGIVSIVSDTWDFWQVITEFTCTLRTEILNREPDQSGLAKVVFRPDSGDPVDILCGDPTAPEDSPEFKGAVECLWDIFGGQITSTGHRLLNDRVGLIYGDSITLDRARQIVERLKSKGFASTNVVLGIGSFTYQCVTRDTFGTAIKATYGQVNGEPRELFKAPKTDNGSKHSARGLLRVEREKDHYVLYDQQTPEQEKKGALRPVFEDGRLIHTTSLQEIRDRLSAELD